ncbi:hypothetical protein R6Q59_025131 [Mikania micrantha]
MSKPTPLSFSPIILRILASLITHVFSIHHLSRALSSGMETDGFLYKTSSPLSATVVVSFPSITPPPAPDIAGDSEDYFLLRNHILYPRIRRHYQKLLLQISSLWTPLTMLTTRELRCRT